MLSEMPHELVAQILAILSTPDAAQCMAVCRAWQDLVLMADAYWHDQLASDFGVEIADLQRQLQAEGKRAPPGAMAAYAYTFAQKFKWRLFNSTDNTYSREYNEGFPFGYAERQALAAGQGFFERGAHALNLDLFACEDSGVYGDFFPPHNALMGVGPLGCCWCTTPGNDKNVSIVVELRDGCALVTAIGAVNPAAGFSNPVRDLLAFGSLNPPEIAELDESLNPLHRQLMLGYNCPPPPLGHELDPALRPARDLQLVRSAGARRFDALRREVDGSLSLEMSAVAPEGVVLVVEGDVVEGGAMEGDVVGEGVGQGVVEGVAVVGVTTASATTDTPDASATEDELSEQEAVVRRLLQAEEPKDAAARLSAGLARAEGTEPMGALSFGRDYVHASGRQLIRPCAPTVCRYVRFQLLSSYNPSAQEHPNFDVSKQQARPKPTLPDATRRLGAGCGRSAKWRALPLTCVVCCPDE